MEQKIKCIYRKKNFGICSKTIIKNTCFCCKHIHSKKKHLYKLFYKIFNDKSDLQYHDIYEMYVYIVEKTQGGDDEDFAYILFFDLLKNIPIVKLNDSYKNYINYDNVPNIKKSNMYRQIYLLCKKTQLFSKKCNVNIFADFQNIIKYKILSIRNSGSNFLNEDDVFTSVNICDIPPRKLFTIKDTKGIYGFDIVEFEYFIRKCLDDNVIPYNPYTREKIEDENIWRLNMKLKYHNISKKNDECRWTTEMNAYTDLSIEIERRGFYNNPEWFKKMSKQDFLKCIKLFRDFSNNIEESNKYFLNINDETFTYDFCKESIKLFNECNNNFYILCCNYMKSLALCSNDFYNNSPEWLSSYETPSYISDIYNFTSYITTLINNSSNINMLNNNNNNNNNNIAYNNDDIRNHLLHNITDINMNMNMNEDPQPSTINPSNNFLLYYYVEYM
jgi:hypothetical protein